MKILALVLARGGSKRLPGKNIALLGGKPLIVWSIDSAKAIPEICDILVSTDDLEIAKISEKAGAMVPWLRPENLSRDETGSAEAAIHALDWYEKEVARVDGVLLLQPTSPFRKTDTIQAGIKLFVESRNAIVGVSISKDHPMWSFRMEDGFLVPFISNLGAELRSQDLPQSLSINGCLYLISPSDLKSKNSFIGGNLRPLLIEDPIETIDIDTAWDFKLAQSVIRML
ncbi:acylneuraminate cytidylyltransferase family protein [Polynucleobacter sphagniphilus]|uniref:acylneuraminate cytidylyltransferase family protein n=1 Tax=Polynucleobacter sphagniphilus TaxID=1743169 RepID=UPI002473325C|nr:acylneuraminate cytidylyltransferase family protein [Polynucleobacter sphagniphilus]MDH6525575.1 CMP-N,N'-diacetyllegionaminic acid synthase [Polynucleobacter sphagniphilus]